MAEVYRVDESKVIKEAHQLEKLLLEACDLETRALLRSTEMSIWPCGSPCQPTLMVSCKSREVAEAIGSRQAALKTILKRVIGCRVVLAVHYTIPEGFVYFDTEGEVSPARWYLCNRKEFGKLKIALPT